MAPPINASVNLSNLPPPSLHPSPQRGHGVTTQFSLPHLLTSHQTQDPARGGLFFFLTPPQPLPHGTGLHTTEKQP